MGYHSCPAGQGRSPDILVIPDMCIGKQTLSPAAKNKQTNKQTNKKKPNNLVSHSSNITDSTLIKFVSILVVWSFRQTQGNLENLS